jgi:hypothetical protein
LILVGPGSGPHRSSLHCARCGRHCGWLSCESAKFLSDIITHFGRPTEPVRVRLPKPSAVPNSAPLGADAACQFPAPRSDNEQEVIHVRI